MTVYPPTFSDAECKTLEVFDLLARFMDAFKDQTLTAEERVEFLTKAKYQAYKLGERISDHLGTSNLD